MNKSTKERPRAGPDAADNRKPDARKLREHAVAEVRRSLVLDAARSAFFELGLDGASLREIARRAGYTPGAIYSYFSSKEDIYGALLGESLTRLEAHVGSTPDGHTASARLQAKAAAFFDFYRQNPRDLDLGFYLFHGVRPMGLTRELNRHLNAQLRAALRPAEEAMIELGLDPAAAQTEITALFAHMVGLLILGHTARIRMFRQDPQTLFEHYLRQLVARLEQA